jgi:hypothetical protein
VALENESNCKPARDHERCSSRVPAVKFALGFPRKLDRYLSRPLLFSHGACSRADRMT